jgi:outer membrane protein OmpA-like peptidoglycan-associated protein
VPGLTRRLPLLLCFASATAGAGAQIPLCPGLKIVTAITQSGGDYESIKTIESVDAKEVRLRYASEAPDRDLLSTTAGQIVKNTLYRKLLLADLRSAEHYEQVFAPNSDELLPGTTAIGTSAAVLQALRTKGSSPLAISNVYAGVPLKADRSVRPNAYDYFTPGTLTRVGTVKVPMLVNDRMVELTAIHARGEYVGETHEFFFLDDDANPLTLKFRLGVGAIKPMQPELASACESARKAGIDSVGPYAGQCSLKGGDRDTLQVTKISYRCVLPPDQQAGGGAGSGGPGLEQGGGGHGSGGSGLEQALAQSGKVDVYSIFFSYDSAAIRPESKETLDEIAAVMRKHPEWKLSIVGHTDNIASDSYNLDLSRRRAAAVTQTLQKDYSIGAARLTSSGMGESIPRDTNDTLEGRAHNRRVELVRLP